MAASGPDVLTSEGENVDFDTASKGKEDSGSIGDSGSVNLGPVVYTVIARGERFELSEEMIKTDSPNFFTAAFLGDFTEAKKRTVDLGPAHDPDLFRLVVNHLSGYQILPLAEKACPRLMDVNQTIHNLHQMATFLGLDRLQTMLCGGWTARDSEYVRVAQLEGSVPLAHVIRLRNCPVQCASRRALDLLTLCRVRFLPDSTGKAVVPIIFGCVGEINATLVRQLHEVFGLPAPSSPEVGISSVFFTDETIILFEDIGADDQHPHEIRRRGVHLRQALRERHRYRDCIAQGREYPLRSLPHVEILEFLESLPLDVKGSTSHDALIHLYMLGAQVRSIPQLDQRLERGVAGEPIVLGTLVWAHFITPARANEMQYVSRMTSGSAEHEL